MANAMQREIKAKKQKQDTVTSFNYLGAVISDDGTKPEILLRIAQVNATLQSGSQIVVITYISEQR